MHLKSALSLEKEKKQAFDSQAQFGLCRRTEEPQSVTSVMGLLCGRTISHAQLICLPCFVCRRRQQGDGLQLGAVNTGSVAVPSTQEARALSPREDCSSCLHVQGQLGLGNTKTCRTLSDLRSPQASLAHRPQTPEKRRAPFSVLRLHTKPLLSSML